MTLNGCRLGFYEPLRKALTTALYNDSHKQSLGINIFSGAMSGILGAAAGSPFFLVKTRLQSFSPFLPVGTQHDYRNAVDGLRRVHGSEGVKGLYRGVGAAMVRTGFGSSVQLPTYFFAKRQLVKHLRMKEETPLHLASSAASGFVVCCVMHPPGNPFGDPFLHRIDVDPKSVQIQSCRVCTIKPGISTRVSTTVCIKPSAPKESWPSTRVSSLTWLASSHTR